MEIIINTFITSTTYFILEYNCLGNMILKCFYLEGLINCAELSEEINWELNFETFYLYKLKVEKTFCTLSFSRPAIIWSPIQNQFGVITVACNLNFLFFHFLLGN